MLEDSLFESQGQKKTRKPMTVVVSAIAHLVTIGVLVMVPLFQTHAVTVPAADMALFLPQIELPKPPGGVYTQPRVQPYTQVDTNILTAPESIPERILYVDAPPKVIPGFGSPTGSGKVISILTGIPNPAVEAPPVVLPPPPLPPPPAVSNTKPIRVSHLQPADLVHQVNPVYPPLARQTRVQGVVVLEATISKEGTIESLRMVSGHPLLTGAALDAVKQWRYRPVFLNGEPIDIITTVTVSFTLQ